MKRDKELNVLPASGYRFAIITATFNSNITHKLHQGALRCLEKASGTIVSEDFVPGAFELPLAAQHIGSHPNIDAVITLGCLIKGETPHFEYVSSESARGLMTVGLALKKPVIFGVLTTLSLNQALERCLDDNSNKGFEAALTAITLLNIIKRNPNATLSA
jgi:6,7-dimethyl-8-ribityllumazine synthase